MSTELQPTYRIHTYNLVDFVQEIEKATKLGYTVDVTTIPHYPQLLGTQFIMTMVLPSVVEVKQEGALEPVQELEVIQTSTDTPVVQEAAVEAPKKPGRPTKK